MAVDQAIRIVGQIGVGAVDQGARRAYEKKVGELSNEQQQKLNADLLRATTDAEKLRILNAATAQARGQSALNKIALSRNIGFIILGVGVLGLAVALVYTARKKK
jgi:hypothetical protein